MESKRTLRPPTPAIGLRKYSARDMEYRCRTNDGIRTLPVQAARIVHHTRNQHRWCTARSVHHRKAHRGHNHSECNRLLTCRYNRSLNTGWLHSRHSNHCTHQLRRTRGPRMLSKARSTSWEDSSHSSAPSDSSYCRPRDSKTARCTVYILELQHDGAPSMDIASSPRHISPDTSGASQ